jgi:hypothetical protein
MRLSFREKRKGILLLKSSVILDSDESTLILKLGINLRGLNNKELHLKQRKIFEDLVVFLEEHEFEVYNYRQKRTR